MNTRSRAKAAKATTTPTPPRNLKRKLVEVENPLLDDGESDDDTTQTSTPQPAPKIRKLERTCSDAVFLKDLSNLHRDWFGAPVQNESAVAIGEEGDFILPEATSVGEEFFIPEDVLYMIMVQLSRVTLASAKRVCKYWLKLASHPDLSWRKTGISFFIKENYFEVNEKPGTIPYRTQATYEKYLEDKKSLKAHKVKLIPATGRVCNFELTDETGKFVGEGSTYYYGMGGTTEFYEPEHHYGTVWDLFVDSEGTSRERSRDCDYLVRQWHVSLLFNVPAFEALIRKKELNLGKAQLSHIYQLLRTSIAQVDLPKPPEGPYKPPDG